MPLQVRYLSPENGRSAMFRARLTAVVTSRWCREQAPDMRRGRILPRSVMNSLSSFESL